ncbi:NINE protein [Paenibacillus physcomitrellae]|nr:TM2 domain-containing protein [Paenibacillus physcomitrellae]
MIKRELTAQELLVLNSEMERQEKSLALAYLMLLGGHLGVHRFYLKKTGTAVVQLILFLAALLLYFLFAVLQGIYPEDEFSGLLPLLLSVLCGIILTVWIIIDLFLIPRMIREWNDRTEQELIRQLMTFRRPPHTPN